MLTGSLLPLELLTPPPWMSHNEWARAIALERRREETRAAHYAPAARRMLERVRTAIQQRGYSARTARSYCAWVRRFLAFHWDRDPGRLSSAELGSYFTHLATVERVGAATHNQAFSALHFFFRDVLKASPEGLRGTRRPKVPARLPIILSEAEVRAALGQLRGTLWLLAALMYGTGLRLTEALELRVQDFHIARGILQVRNRFGQRVRETLLPVALIEPLRDHLENVRRLHVRDLAAGSGSVPLPEIAGSLGPDASWELSWQWAFPATRFFVNRQNGRRQRHHIHQTVVQRAFNAALRAALVPKAATCHSLRHSFAVHLLESGCDIRTLQELLGHKHLGTTMIYTRVASIRSRRVTSPLDSDRS